jgi:hypothetical protein
MALFIDLGRRWGALIINIKDGLNTRVHHTFSHFDMLAI